MSVTLALSRSSSSLKNLQSQDTESHPCSIYTTTVGDPGSGIVGSGGKFATLATIDMEDSMTLSAENIPLNINRDQAARIQPNDCRPTDESPTKTTFISDEEWPDQVSEPLSSNLRLRVFSFRYSSLHRCKREVDGCVDRFEITKLWVSITLFSSVLLIQGKR